MMTTDKNLFVSYAITIKGNGYGCAITRSDSDFQSNPHKLKAEDVERVFFSGDHNVPQKYASNIEAKFLELMDKLNRREINPKDRDTLENFVSTEWAGGFTYYQDLAM